MNKVCPFVLCMLNLPGLDIWTPGRVRTINRDDGSPMTSAFFFETLMQCFSTLNEQTPHFSQKKAF